MSEIASIAFTATDDDVAVIIAALEYAMLENKAQTLAARKLAKQFRKILKNRKPQHAEAFGRAAKLW